MVQIYTASSVEDICASVPRRYRLSVFYGTQTGTAKQFASALCTDAQDRGVEVNMANLEDSDPEDTLTQEVSVDVEVNMAPTECTYLQCRGDGCVSVFLVSTYTDGAPPDSAKWFCQWLSEAVDDFRVQKSLLSGVKFAVFALGNSLYADHYNSVGRNLFDWLSKLSATPVCALGLGDQNVAQSANGGKTAYMWWEVLYYISAI